MHSDDFKELLFYAGAANELCHKLLGFVPTDVRECLDRASIMALVYVTGGCEEKVAAIVSGRERVREIFRKVFDDNVQTQVTH